MTLCPRLIIEKEFEKFTVYSLMSRVKEGNDDLSISEQVCRALATVTAIGWSHGG